MTTVMGYMFKIDLIVWKYGANTDKLFIGVEFKIDLIVWKWAYIFKE